MRQTDYKLAKAFAEWKKMWAGNTVILEEDDSIKMALHGNVIIARPKSSIDLTLNLPVRWQTQTTKNRVNAVLEELNYPITIKAIKTVWYFIMPDGSKKEVVPGINFIHK